MWLWDHNLQDRILKEKESITRQVTKEMLLHICEIHDYLLILNNQEGLKEDNNINAILTSVNKKLEYYGVNIIDEESKEFNPEDHNALSNNDVSVKILVNNYPDSYYDTLAGKILVSKVLRRGYKTNDYVIRPADVETIKFVN